MSGAGINPLAIIAPDLYAKQLAIQRRQALAQGLLEQSQGNAGSAPYGGLRNAGNAVLGAFLAKRGDKDLADLYSPQPTDPGQISSAAGSGPVMPSAAPQGGASGAMPMPVQSQPLPPPDQGGAPTQTPQMAMGNALTGNAPQSTQSPPRSIPNAIGGAIPDLPGMTHQQSMLAYFQSPSAYFTALAAANAPTNEQKNINSAYGAGTPEATQMLQGTLQKGAAINLRPGGGALNYATGQITTMPGANGIQTLYPQGMNGPAVQAMAPGAADALTQSTAATGLGKAATTPAIAYGPDQQPIATNQAQMLGGSPLGIRTNNPGNLQPGGQQANYGSAAEGILRASQNLDSYAAQGINTLGGIISRWAPPGQNNTASYIADASKRLGVDPNQSLNLKDPRVKGAVLDAIFTHENGAGTVPAPKPLLPELPQGQATFMQGQAKDAADRHDAAVAAAAESPMRINVLDNIIKLSQSGVTTGPGSEFQNSIKGYLANTPGLGKLLGSTQENVGNFQELQKFMYQNALRNWQAAGGTGTDSQLESAAKANPNDHLFPQALQTIAKWGKASELAVQGKANAQDAYLQTRGNTPTNQIAFEHQWRNSFDPKVFQYNLMSPQEKQQFAQQQLKTPQAAQAFIAKQQALQQIGALQ